jgi:uncharacterized protein (TIGR00255 family)
MATSGARGPLSMTGYGRAAKRAPLVDVTVELRSTNHRYLEIDARLPNGLTALQGRLTELVRRQIRRGRIEAQVAVQSSRRDQRRVSFDAQLLARYHAALVELTQRFGLEGGVTLDHLLALPQALTVSEERTPAEELWEPIRQAAEAAVRELVRSRQREGSKLVRDIRTQLQTIEARLRAVKRRLPRAFEQQRRRLRERLQELLGSASNVSPGQLEQAAALAKDADINEELVRLESHLAHVLQSLAGRALIGKRLDFIAQELMREANTMGAKVNDAEAAQHVVEIKGCIEKIREQVQNLE